MLRRLLWFRLATTTFVFIVPIVLLILQQVGVGVEASVVPGDVSWLGDFSGGDGTTDDYNRLLPLAYVLFGPDQLAVVRMIVPLSANCPTLASFNFTNTTNATSTNENARNTSGDSDTVLVPQVQTRAVGDWIMPDPFPIRVCDVRLETIEQRRAYNRNEFVFSGINREKLPLIIPEDPQRFLFLSDTGLRLRPYNLGVICNTNNMTDLYGVPQCPMNITKNQLSSQNVRVDAQAIDDWPLQNLLNKAVQQAPDVVVFAGGALYRQGPCPATSGVKCVGINGGGYYHMYSDGVRNHTSQAFNTNDTSVIANFLPGRWGDNWFGWWADFVFPSRELLKTAPWIVARGDLESTCDAGGRGYWLLLSTDEYPNNTRAGDYCPEGTSTMKPYAVSFDQEQIIVMNSASHSSINDTVESDTGECPDVLETRRSRSRLVPRPQNSSDSTENQIQLQDNWETIQNLSLARETNFLVSHRPVFGVYCSQAQLYTTGSTLQANLGNTSMLDHISGIFSGHQNVLQVLEFEDNSLPIQLTLGHGGTKVDETIVDPDLFPYVSLQVGESLTPVSRGLSTKELHGFTLMDRNPSSGNYDISFYSLDTVADAMAVLNYPLTITKGPRITTNVPTVSPTSAPSTAPTIASDRPGNSIVSPSTSSSVSWMATPSLPWLILLSIANSICATTLL